MALWLIIRFKNLDDNEFFNSNFQSLRILSSHIDLCNLTDARITKTGHFLWYRSSKIQCFTNIWYPFWQRLLRLCQVRKVSNGWSGINSSYSGTHWTLIFWRFAKLWSRQVFTLYQILMVNSVCKRSNSVWDTLY